MSYNHNYCMFCGQSLAEDNERNTPRPLCAPCREKDAQGQRLCPACRETIQKGAVMCRFCQSPLLPGAGGGVHGYAVASLVLGIFGPFFCGIPAILAIVFGFLALKEIGKSGGSMGGSGMAKWGRGLGIAWLTIALLIMLFAFAGGVLSGLSGQ